MANAWSSYHSSQTGVFTCSNLIQFASQTLNPLSGVKNAGKSSLSPNVETKTP